MEGNAPLPCHARSFYRRSSALDLNWSTQYWRVLRARLIFVFTRVGRTHQAEILHEVLQKSWRYSSSNQTENSKFFVFFVFLGVGGCEEGQVKTQIKEWFNSLKKFTPTSKARHVQLSHLQDCRRKPGIL